MADKYRVTWVDRGSEKTTTVATSSDANRMYEELVKKDGIEKVSLLHIPLNSMTRQWFRDTKGNRGF